MFKLLIADDEDNTREGILELLSWNELGISQIEQADDGVNALKNAEFFKPDILLTDVRMPRMDGIELSYKLREQYPDCKIIFMSGYSDKAYLKSAIQLKAINYVEKPINLQELSQAVRDAVDLCLEEQNKKKAEVEANKRVNSSIALIKSELAVLMSRKNSDLTNIYNHIKAANLTLSTDGLFSTVLVKIFPASFSHSEQITIVKGSALEALEKACLENGYRQISAFRDDGYIIAHLYINLSEKHLFTTEKLQNFCSQFSSCYGDGSKYFISVGKKVQGIHNVYESYETAVIQIQKAFYRGYNSAIFFNENNGTVYNIRKELKTEFGTVIENGSREKSIFFVKNLSSSVKMFEDTLVNNVKNLFFELLMKLDKAAEKHGFVLIKDYSGTNHLWEYFLKINTLFELEELLVSHINTYYDELNNKGSNNTIVNEVITYIKNNFHDESLSIAKISGNVHLAPTYLCSLFKEKTGRTLNQYITETRIEKSKEMLQDRSNKISDVASKVGLRDRSYFTKLFRKITGVTPSEYK